MKNKEAEKEPIENNDKEKESSESTKEKETVKRRRKVVRKKIREVSRTSVEYKDVIFTGCLDDTIKIWSVHGFELKLEDSIKAHSLGVASLTVNKSHTSTAPDRLFVSILLFGF
ncbi:uncharacterized protein LOC103517953 [Diaphorina citri]|uniref:Uncharacterized protein LOC103517953 n=1 Tax=Diaphorina citri TaxID=121845 RepID=A0A1S3DG64_DIACI|nr:uncharacterized protein LOC103517953 [Diaphorina citri]